LNPTDGPTSGPTSVPDDGTVAGFIASNPNLTQLNRLVQRAGFEDDLASDTLMFTQFAGTDEAFNAIPPAFQFILFENDEFLPHLRNLLLYNILMGEFFEADFTDGAVVTAFNRENFEVTLNPFQVNGIAVSDANNDVSNGVVHIIDDVLTPSWVPRTLINRLEQDTDLSITLEFLNLAGISPGISQVASGNFTLLAPSNQAWIDLGEEVLVFLSDPANVESLQSVLLYHILPGVFVREELFSSRLDTFQGNFVTVSVTPGLRFNQAQVLAVDILANNGVLHKINAVLNFGNGVGADTILDFIAETPELSTFFGGLQRAGLSPTLARDDVAVTVFAPTNAAFNALPNDLLQLLFVNDEFILHLQNLLLYHILTEVIASGDFVNESQIGAANGEGLSITTNPLQVNGRPVQVADVTATNGLTHVLGGVLLPGWVFNSLAARIINDPELSILGEFLELAGISLTPQAALTVLGPTNAAWNKLGFGRLQELRNPLNVLELTDILGFHVGFPIFTSNELVIGAKITTFQGDGTGVVTVTATGPITFNGVDNARSPAVLQVANILAFNGILHKIDTVLDPLDSRP
jgi:transforming growth factor-beta-induced protein